MSTKAPPKEPSQKEHSSKDYLGLLLKKNMKKAKEEREKKGKSVWERGLAPTKIHGIN